jgi:hypothetical protein
MALGHDPRVAKQEPNPLGDLVEHRIGGANIPAHWLRLNATRPFGVLDIRQHGLELSVRPRLFGGDDLRVTPALLAEVFPVKARIGGRGIGFRLPDGREWYFWTLHADRVLDLLDKQGFTVSRSVRRPRRCGGRCRSGRVTNSDMCLLRAGFDPAQKAAGRLTHISSPPSRQESWPTTGAEQSSRPARTEPAGVRHPLDRHSYVQVSGTASDTMA